MSKKIKVGVLFGGKSVEHEVSVNSAENIINHLSKEKYEVVPIKIEKDGSWDWEVMKECEVIFPIVHGAFGEDGSLQGLFKILRIPFVGAGVLGSAIGLDKEIHKKLLRDAGLPVVNFLVVKNEDEIAFEEVEKKLGLPVFVKPANTGSSIGVVRVDNEKDFKEAVKLSFEYDTKVLIEENIVGQELECSVLGNDNPMASRVGEIIPVGGFYSYDAKYILEDGAELLTRATITEEKEKGIQELAIRTFEVLQCAGLARVDFFLDKNGKIYINEINTMPGFTNISMYPKLWEETGITQEKLLDRLIELAFERFDKEEKLKTSYK